jgi:hypothetical protein
VSGSTRVGTGGTSQGVRKTVASIRMSEHEHDWLTRVAEVQGLPAAELGRVLITYGLAKLERGDKELERAVKTSRDA